MIHILSTPSYLEEMQFGPYISPPSSPIWKIPRQKGVIFWHKYFAYTDPNVIFKKDLLCLGMFQI